MRVILWISLEGKDLLFKLLQLLKIVLCIALAFVFVYFLEDHIEDQLLEGVYLLVFLLIGLHFLQKYLVVLLVAAKLGFLLFFEQDAGSTFDLQFPSQKLVLSFDIPDGLLQFLNLFQLFMGHFDDIFIGLNFKRFLNYTFHI